MQDSSPNTLFPIPYGAEAALYFLPGQYVLQYQDRSEGQKVKFLGPAAVAAAFKREPVDSGWLPPNTIRWGISSAGHYLVTYTPPAVREVLVENKEEIETMQVPLPGLIMVGVRSSYYVWATTSGPLHSSTQLARAPFPNINNIGLICWGANEHPDVQTGGFVRIHDTFWAAPFSDHWANGKCVSFPDNARKLLRKLHDDKAAAFPAEELVPMGVTLDDAVARLIDRRRDVWEDDEDL